MNQIHQPLYVPEILANALSQAPMAVTVLRKNEHDINSPQRLASCGRPVPWLHVELLDSHHQAVPDVKYVCVGRW